MIDEKNFMSFMEKLEELGAEYVTFNSLRKFIEQQPKIGEWIPCSERLPKDGKEVLVWFEYFRYGNYNRLFQTYGISCAYKGEWSGIVNGSSGWDDLNIIAWQPLPKQYQGEGRKEHSNE